MLKFYSDNLFEEAMEKTGQLDVALFMWGIRLADSVHLHDMGFIPAHAGNTAS